jgi:ectoine hydroxylase-related dioxygenase (phytanoyl-CoA dioxygenase family)
MKTFTYSVDQKDYTLKIDGDTTYGDHTQLIKQEENIIKNSTFEDLGYTVINFLEEPQLLKLRTEILKHINKLISPITKQDYDINTIAKYHEHVTNQQHREVISTIYDPSGRGIKTTDIDFDFSTIEHRISTICNYKDLICKMPGNLDSEFYIRLVRPSNNSDANPPHRDVWIPRLKNAVNIHFIIAGNDANSTLALLPGSHLWYEDEIERTIVGATTNGNTYQVPSVVNAKRSMNFIRPRLSSNDVLVFSPYMIHGGGPNISNNTRVSLEMRFWPKK